MSSDHPHDLVGTTLAERYALTRVIGMGGMGVVYRATDLQGGHDVAVKTLLPQLDHGGRRARFLREARLAARIKHRGVVQVLDHGRWGVDGSKAYLVMELVEGLPLSKLVDRVREPSLICDLVGQLLEALAHVHARQVIHRDIKPDNLLVTRSEDGELGIKVTDFGISAALDQLNQTRLTREGSFVGSVLYVSPEQLRGAALPGPRIDLYAAGVILYELLFGAAPFHGSLPQLLFAKAAQDIAAPATAELPVGLWDVVSRLVARQPEDRYATASEALGDLAPYRQKARLAAGVWRTLGGQAHAPDVEHRSADTADVEVEARVFGRDDELRRLMDVARELDNGRGGVVLLTGAPGIGKSTLLDEAVARLAEVKGYEHLRATLPAKSGVVAALRSALDRHLGTHGAGPEEVESAVAELLRRHGEADPREISDLVFLLRPPMTGGDLHGRSRDEIFAIFARLLRRFADQRPVALAFDDLHHAGEDARAFVHHFLSEQVLAPFGAVLFATLDRSPEIEAELRRDDRYTSVRREVIALDRMPSEACARWLINEEGLDPIKAREIARMADGNPLFALLLGRGSPDFLSDAATAAPGKTSTDLPPALRAVLEASVKDRLARTSDSEGLQAVLTRCAVLGERVSVEHLAKLCERPEQDLDDALDELIEVGLLREGEVPDVVVFEHSLLRTWLLDSLRKRQRRRLELRAAEVLKECPEDTLASRAGSIGDHLAAGDNPEEAVEWWIRGLAYETRIGDVSRAVRYGLSVLELDADVKRRKDTALRIGGMLRDMGDASRAEDVLAPLLQDPSPTSVATDAALLAGEILAQLFHNRGDGRRWEQTIQSMGEREASASESGRRALDRARAFWFSHQGRYAEGMESARRALEGAPPGEESVRAAILLAFLFGHQGEATKAVEVAQQAVQDAGGHAGLLAEAMRPLAIFDGRGGANRLQQCVHLSRMSGRTLRAVIASTDAAGQLHAEGDPDAALPKLRDARRAAEELGMHGEVARNEFLEILCLVHLGVDGVDLVPRIRSVLRRLEAGGCLCLLRPLHYVLATVFADTGETDRAVALLKSEGDLQERMFLGHFPEILARLGMELVAAGEERDAAAMAMGEHVLDMSSKLLATSLNHRLVRRFQRTLAGAS